MHRDPSPLGDKAHNLVAGDRLAAARNVVHQIADAFHHHATIVFAAILRSIGFLLQLLKCRRILLRRAGLIKLRLQEINHLVEANIAAANRRQQFVLLIKVVARQQILFRILQADAQMLQLIIEDLPSGKNILVAILLAEPGMNFRTPAAGSDVAKVRIQPVTAWVRLLLSDDFNLVAHLQLIGERHNTSADFRPDAAVTDIAVNMVGKIERSRTRR